MSDIEATTPKEAPLTIPGLFTLTEDPILSASPEVQAELGRLIRELVECCEGAKLPYFIAVRNRIGGNTYTHPDGRVDKLCLPWESWLLRAKAYGDEDIAKLAKDWII